MFCLHLANPQQYYQYRSDLNIRIWCYQVLLSRIFLGYEIWKVLRRGISHRVRLTAPTYAKCQILQPSFKITNIRNFKIEKKFYRRNEITLIKVRLMIFLNKKLKRKKHFLDKTLDIVYFFYKLYKIQVPEIEVRSVIKNKKSTDETGRSKFVFSKNSKEKNLFKKKGFLRILLFLKFISGTKQESLPNNQAVLMVLNLRSFFFQIGKSICIQKWWREINWCMDLRMVS